MFALRPKGALRSVLALAAATISIAFIGACAVNVDDLFRASGGVGGGETSGKSATSTTHAVSNGTGPAVTTGANMTTTVTTGPGPTTTHASVQVSSSTGPLGPTVTCGANAGDCEISKGGCCWNSPGQMGHCSTNGNCPGVDTQAKCQVPSDCDGNKICCGKRNNSQSPYDTVECDTQCDAPDVVLCDPMNPVCDEVGTSCVQSGLLPEGYYVCNF